MYIGPLVVPWITMISILLDIEVTVEPRRYRTSVVMTIFVGVGGLALLALIVVLVINGIMSSDLGAGELVICVFGLALAVFFILSALRPAALDIDHTGLRLRKILGSEHIPWESVRSFSVESGGRAGPSLHATLHSGKVVSLPATTSSGATARKIAAELTEALREQPGSDNE